MEINKTEQSRHKNMIHTYDLRLWIIDYKLFPYFPAYINSFFEIENLLFMFFDKSIICIRINIFV